MKLIRSLAEKQQRALCIAPNWRKRMKRWNGWGEETITAPLSAAATAFLPHVVGIGTPPRDATLEEGAASLPASRLPVRPGISTDPMPPLRHARGQGLPDWI